MQTVPLSSSNPVVLVILFPQNANFTYIVNESNPVTFECTAAGIPAPTISWFRDGSLLNEASDSRITLSNHSDPVIIDIDGESVFQVTRTLTLDSTMNGDSGTYTCFSDNNVIPSVTQDFELLVQGMPVSIIVQQEISQSTHPLHPQLHQSSLTHLTI